MPFPLNLIPADAYAKLAYWLLGACWLYLLHKAQKATADSKLSADEKALANDSMAVANELWTAETTTLDGKVPTLADLPRLEATAMAILKARGANILDDSEKVASTIVRHRLAILMGEHSTVTVGAAPVAQLTAAAVSQAAQAALKDANPGPVKLVAFLACLCIAGGARAQTADELLVPAGLVSSLVPTQIAPPIPDKWEITLLPPGIRGSFVGNAPVAVAATFGLHLAYLFGKATVALPGAAQDPATGQPKQTPLFGVGAFIVGGANISNAPATEAVTLGLDVVIADSVACGLGADAVAGGTGVKLSGFFVGTMSWANVAPMCFYSISLSAL